MVFVRVESDLINWLMLNYSCNSLAWRQKNRAQNLTDLHWVWYFRTNSQKIYLWTSVDMQNLVKASSLLPLHVGRILYYSPFCEIFFSSSEHLWEASRQLESSLVYSHTLTQHASAEEKCLPQPTSQVQRRNYFEDCGGGRGPAAPVSDWHLHLWITEQIPLKYPPSAGKFQPL